MSPFNSFSHAFIVKDPKTYINAEDAWYEFNCNKETSVLFVIIPKGDPNKTLSIFDEIIDISKWGHVVWYHSLSNFTPRGLKERTKRSYLLKWYVSSRENIYNFIDRSKLDSIAASFTNINVVFTSHRNTQMHLTSALKPNIVYILDSGLNIRNKINSDGYIGKKGYSRLKHPLRYLIDKVVKFEEFNPPKTRLFTAYVDSLKTKHRIIKNNFSYRKMLINEKIVGDRILFVSTPIYIFKSVSKKTYADFIKSIFEKLTFNLEDAIYIPHPTYEEEEDIKEICSLLNCDYDDRDIPVESKITLYDKLPASCISPYSSALVNLAAFSEGKFSVICAWHYEFDAFEVIKEWKVNSLQKIDNLDIIILNESDVKPLFNLGTTTFIKPIYKNFQEYGFK